MGTQGGEHLFRCPCYDDHTEYQKIVELKDAGLVIYRQTSRHEDGSLDLDLALPSASTEDIFILHNTKDIEILSADIMPAFEQNKISCLRCRHIIENAQKLLKSIPKIYRNDIMGICDHCRRKISRSPCKECDEVVQKFVSDRDKGKDAKRHIRVWLSKIHHLLRDVVIGERNIFKQKSRSYSDINIDNLHHNSPVSMREPEVTDLFYSENLKTGSTRTLHMSDRSCYSHPGFPKIKKKTTFLDYLEQEKNYLSPSQGKPYHSRSYDDLSYINYELPLIEAQRGEFRKRKLITDLTSNRLSVPPITSIHGKYHSEESILPLGKYHSEESVYPVTKYQYLSDDTLIPQEKRQLEARYVSHGRYKPDGLILAHRKQTPDERILAHRKRSPEERLKPRIRYSEDEMYMTIGKHSPEDRQRLMTHRKRSDEERQRFMMHGKYSEEDRFLHGKYTPENRLSPHRKYTSEERLTAHEKHTRKESLTPYRKHKSEETLVTSISGIIEDHLKQDFGYFFPHEVEDTVKIRKKRISSSELIKDTQDKLQARAEEERIRLEEERRRKREEEEQKRIAKEKARLLREEAKRLAEEAKRRAEEEKRKAEEEEKRLAEEERKRLEEEEKKRLAEEEKKKRAEERQKKLIEKEKKPPKPESVKKVKEALPEKKKAPAEKLKSKERLPEKPKVREPPPEKPKVKEPPPEKPPTKLPSPEKPKVKEPSSEKPPIKQPSPEKPKVKEPPPPPPPPPEVPKVKPPSPEKPKNEPSPDIPKPEPKEKPKKEKPEAVAKEKKEKKEKEPVATEVKEPVKEEVKESVKPKPEPKPEPTPGEDFRKLVEEQAKLKEERLRLRKLKEEEERKAREAAEKKAKEMDQAAKTEIKASKKTETEKPKPQKQQEQPTTKDLNIKQIKLKNPSVDDLILRLVKMKQANQGERLIKNEMSGIPRILYNHKGHKNTKDANCLVCTDSDIELDLESITNKRDEIKMADIIIGPKIFKYKPPIPPPPDEQKHEQILPIVFKSTYKEETVSVVEKTENIPTVVTVEPEKKPPPLLVPTKGSASAKGKQPVELEVPKGIVRYALSDRSFIDKGWTMLPTEKVVRKMNVYRMRPAHPEFDWFEHNKNKRLMTYDTGEKLAEFDDNGRGRWYYKNGRLALDYYDAEEINAQQRFVVYSSGEPDERGRSRPITILATFDYLGNGIVFDHSGKIRLKYNQTEGVVLDRAIGPVSHWKWHTLNDPPVLQQVMIDTQMPHKDPDIIKLGGPGDNKARPDNEEMLAIEFDNFIKEKSKKLTQKFKPFQIKMKALKINESFSLRVLDQATIYLIFRDGSANLKLNIGMILDHKEIVDTDTAEVGEVSNNLQRLPARTDSIAGLQRSVAHAQRVERLRVERERRLRPAEPCGSADRLTAAAARPLRAPFRTASDSTVPTTSQYPCKCRKPSSCNLYYDTRLF